MNDPASKDAFRILRELGRRCEATYAAIRGRHDLVVVQRFGRVGDQATTVIEREARSLSKNWHPNVARVRHVETVDGELFVATEFLDGMTLADLRDRTSAIPAPIIVRIVLDVLA